MTVLGDTIIWSAIWVLVKPGLAMVTTALSADGASRQAGVGGGGGAVVAHHGGQQGLG